MKDITRTGNIKFWIDEEIIYCKIYSGFDQDSLGKEVEDIFVNAISSLSKGKFRPILINMQEINHSLSIKIFKFLSNNFQIKTIVLSKTFLVNSIMLKYVLSIYNFTGDPIISNTIFKDHNLAIKYCDKKYMLFNAISNDN